MLIDGVEFSENYRYFGTGEVVWVPVDWLMRNALNSCDFGYEFSLEEMLEEKCADTGFGHLVESIMEHGFMETGAIGFHNGEITEGHHRFCAAILLCLDEVPISAHGKCAAPRGEYICAHYNDIDEYPIYLS